MDNHWAFLFMVGITLGAHIDVSVGKYLEKKTKAVRVVTHGFKQTHGKNDLPSFMNLSMNTVEFNGRGRAVTEEAAFYKKDSLSELTRKKRAIQRRQCRRRHAMVNGRCRRVLSRESNYEGPTRTNTSLAEDGCRDDCFKNSKGKCECGMAGIYSSSCERNNRTGECIQTGGCFHGNSTVLLESGQAIKMYELVIGDKIQTSSEEFSPFVGWLDWMPDTETVFLTLHTERTSITLTPTHMIFVKSGDKTVTKYARDVSVLDELINKDGKPEVVSRITKSVATGYFSPLTEPGTLVVDNLLTSCFASFPHELANMVLFPVRTWPSVFLGTDGGPGTYIKLVKTLGTFLNIRDAAIPALLVRDFAKQEF